MDSVSGGGGNPASLLSDPPESIKKYYTITLNQTSNGQKEFTLHPKSKDISVQWIKVQFSKTLVGLSFQDNLGRKNVFQFTTIKENPSLSDERFQFQAPKNVDVITSS